MDLNVHGFIYEMGGSFSIVNKGSWTHSENFDRAGIHSIRSSVIIAQRHGT